MHQTVRATLKGPWQSVESPSPPAMPLPHSQRKAPAGRSKSSLESVNEKHFMNLQLIVLEFKSLIFQELSVEDGTESR